MNPQTNYIGHTLNHSLSKYAYSFTKSQRLGQGRKVYTQAIYELPQRSASRTCSFGYGKKTELVQRQHLKSPSPNKYQILSEFQLHNRKKGFKFGSGRNNSSFRSFLSNAKANNPPPNKYEIPSTLKDINITLKKKLPSEIQINIKKFTPGPGSYYPVGGELAPNGKYILSNYRNAPSSTLDIGMPYAPQRYSGSGLGPGTYNITKNGQPLKQSCKTFSKQKRAQPDDVTKRRLPGPGQYPIFSEFGELKISKH